MARTNLFVLLALLIALVPVVTADEAKQARIITRLAKKQADAAQRLENLLKTIDDLVVDLRSQGEKRKAELLERAKAIVVGNNVPIDYQADAQGRSREELADLQRAMARLTKVLEKGSEHSAEAGRLAGAVIDTLEKILSVLTEGTDLEDLKDREQEVRRARKELRDLANRQERLRRETQRSVAATEAEKLAARASKELADLQRQVESLDRGARRDLGQLDAARERAARISDLLDRQRRVRADTAVRAGKADALRPKIQQETAELEAVADAAMKTADREAQAAGREEQARAAERLAERQEKLATEIAVRDDLEQVVMALRGQPAEGEDKSPVDIAKLLEKAAQGAPEDKAAALRRAAEDFHDSGTADFARKALQAALNQLASRETLASDQEVLQRDVAALEQRVRDEQAQRELRAAAEAAERSHDALKTGRGAREDARAARDALKRAAEALRKEDTPPEAAEQQRKDVERAAERAQGAADRLAKLARSEEANEAGLQVALEQAAQQAREAARKMRAAAQASQDGGNRRAQEDAQAAAEQAAGAARRLGAAVQEREELPERQRKIEEDLRRLREDSQDRHAAELRKAQDEAAKAVTELRGGRFQEALPHQKAIEASLQKMGAQANAEVQRAGREVQAKMERLQNATLAAADKAGKTREALKQGKRFARERDARERLDDAERHTEEAEKALRRSLRRLTEARPKSAEEERRQAREELGRAQDRLNGVREAHKRLTDEEREQLRKLAQKQHNLEDQVRRLEERLRKQNERGAAERMQDAQSAMRDAQRGMRGGDPDEAEQGQDRAQKSLQQAQDELERQERRYRNLRQHELLFRLKEQLRAYRRSAQAFLEELQAIDAEARRAGRVKRNLYRSSVVPLKDKVSAMSRDVGEKVESIKEEGAVVYTYILTQCQSDLSEVAGLLAMKEVGILPQELTGDVVRRFDLTLKGLERDLRERRDDQQNQQQRGQKGQQGQQSPEERPRLVPQDAEIRMILVLQRTLNEETNNFFKARPRFADRRTTESEKARLERLAHQQGSLGELFESLKESLLPAGDGTGDLELPPKPGDGEKPGKEEQPGGDGARNVPRGVPLQGMPGQQTIEDLQKQMKEISRLMQESERELLELTTLDRIVKQQSELRRKLEELERSKEPETEAKREARRKKRGELERGQEQTRRRIADLLQGPEMRGHQLVSSLEKLLRSMPRGNKGGGRGGKQGKQPKPRQLDPNKEQMQTQPKDGKRTKNERRERKPEDKPGSGADARRRVEAWLARLPPEEQERIRRGDLSGVPLRYRPIIERITVERAAREGKGSGE